MTEANAVPDLLGLSRAESVGAKTSPGVSVNISQYAEPHRQQRHTGMKTDLSHEVCKCSRFDAVPCEHIDPRSQIGVTILDLDRTLTRTGTYTPFLIYAASKEARWRLLMLPAVVLFMLAYKLRLLRRKTLKEAMHRLMLGERLSMSAVERLSEGFAERTMRSNVYTDAIRLIAEEQRQRRTVILATAAHRFYGQAIAARLGIDHVVATESVWKNGVLCARLNGENCYGIDKAAAVESALEAFGLARSAIHVRCYSDDVSDLPSFEASDEPIGVNPSARLAKMCRTRGWPVLRLN